MLNIDEVRAVKARAILSCMAAGALWLVGCGASASQPAPRGPRNAGEEHEADPARLGSYALPPWPAAVQSSRDLQDGLRLARAFFALPRSLPANDIDQDGYQAWMEGDFKAWLGRCAQALEAAELRLEAVATGTAAEQAVAATAVALMYEQLATQFLAAPTPPVLRDDRELVQIFHDGLRTAAKQWVDRAENAYGSCARAAAADSSLQPWRALCLEHERAQRAWLASLPPPESERAEPAPALDGGERPPGSEACWETGVPQQLPQPKRAPPAAAGQHVATIVFNDEVPLLAQERRALAAAVQAALQRQSQGAGAALEWLDDATRERMVAEWSNGQATASGPRCARVRPLLETLAQRIPGLITVHVGHACADGALSGEHCELLVGVCCGDAVPRGVATDLKAPLASSLAELSTWTRAASELQPAKPVGHIIGVLREGYWHSPVLLDLALNQLANHGPWTRAELDAQLEQTRAGLLACRKHAPYAHELPVVVSVGTRGTVDEVWHDDAPRALGAQQRCIDRALRRMRFAPAERARRFAAVLVFGAGGAYARDATRDWRFGPRVPGTGVRVSLSSNDARVPTRCAQDRQLRMPARRPANDRERRPLSARRERLALAQRGADGGAASDFRRMCTMVPGEPCASGISSYAAEAKPGRAVQNASTKSL